MKLYVFNYWVPFPSSEYGGLIVIAADNIDECVELAKELDYSYNPSDREVIKEYILKGTVYELKYTTTSKIVEAFTT
jgi:hypothetical protein